MERITGIEPASSAWEADVLPMNYIRKNIHRPNTVGAFGGDKRDRTADLLNAIQALSQLSYTPERYNITIYVYKFQDLFLKIKY